MTCGVPSFPSFIKYTGHPVCSKIEWHVLWQKTGFIGKAWWSSSPYVLWEYLQVLRRIEISPKLFRAFVCPVILTSPQLCHVWSHKPFTIPVLKQLASTFSKLWLASFSRCQAIPSQRHLQRLRIAQFCFELSQFRLEWSQFRLEFRAVSPWISCSFASNSSGCWIPWGGSATTRSHSWKWNVLSLLMKPILKLIGM